MLAFFIFSLLFNSVYADKPWKQCYGVEYLHYDKTCCDSLEQYADNDRHCLESLPKLDYSKAIDDLNNTLEAMTICNSANTCSNNIDFVEVVRQAENLHNITNGGASLAEGASDHLIDKDIRLTNISSGILPSITLESGGTLFAPVGTTIDVIDGAAFILPNSIEFHQQPNGSK